MLALLGGTPVAFLLAKMSTDFFSRGAVALLAGFAVAAFVSPLTAQTISSAANQTFVVNDASTAASAMSITDDPGGAKIKANKDIRVSIPAGFNMTWDATVTTATITGSAAGKVSTAVTYAAGNTELVIDVTTNFAAGDQIVVSGLRFTSFAAPSAAGSLGLGIAGAGGAVVDTDDKTKTIVAPTLTGGANQTFVVGDPSTAMTSVTITDAATPTITAANDIRLRIPAGFNMTWNTGITTATIGGGAAGKVSTTVSYENAGQVLVLNVTSNFAAGDQITISGLQFTNFTAVSAAANLQLVVSGSAGGGTAATSSTTKQIVQPTISSAANQTFVVTQVATAMSTITVTENATAATITAANDLRIRIPVGFSMTWNTALTTATIGGASAAKVSTTVTYEDAGRTLVLNVTSNFATSNQITVSGLQYANFTAASGANNLQLVISGAGRGTAATDNRTITIVAPTIASAANQTFVVGAVSTTMSAITVTDATTASITAANDIRIHIPAGLNMTWDPTVTTATIAGGASGKVSTTVSYANGNLDLVLNVTSNFVASDQIVVSGLKFTSFTAASPASNLELVTAGSGGAAAAIDNRTKTIVAPTISSAANQVFVVGAVSTAMSTITITDASTATITSTNNIRIRIPAGFNMTWNTALTTVTIGGGAAAKVSTTVTYEDASTTLVLDLTSSFVANDQITVSGLQFNNFTATSPAANLQLVVSGAGGGTAATDDKTKTVVAPTLTETAGQVFVVGALPASMTTATVTDAATPTITAANDIRLRIPAGFNMTWNTALTTATIAGGAAAKVSTTVSYEAAGKTLVLNVTSDFGASDQLSVSGLQFNTFTAVSAPVNMQLVVSGAGGSTAATSDKTKEIVAPTIASAANQTFGVADPATAMSTITVTDAGTATITAANDIRIRIPATFNMTWNSLLTTATIGGGAAGKVSTTVSYEDAGKTLVLNVTGNFAASDQITVSGLQFTNFTASSAGANLELVIAGASGATAATDTRTKTIVGATISSAASQTFVVGEPAITMSTITVTDATIATITAANDIRIRIPVGLNMTWNTSQTTATIGGGAAAKVSTTVSYEDAGKTLVLNVTANFAAGDQITVSTLQFGSFTAVSGVNTLGLIVGGSSGGIVGIDNTTKQIVAPTISSAANQTFVAGQAATAMSTMTVIDAGVATITAANDIRIRIPATFNMTWNTSLTTATLGGGAAAKMSTTVTYEDAGKTLVLNVTSNFAVSDQITVTGLQFTNFTALSPADYMQLVVTGSAGAPSAIDDKTVTIFTVGVTITPHSAASNRLPSNGVTYTATGTLQNTGSATDSYDILASYRPGTAVTLVSITGPGVSQGANPDSARLSNLAVGVAASVTLTYSVGNVAAGLIDTLFVLGRSTTFPAARDSVKLAVTVIRPNLTFSKAVVPSGTQLPGTDLTYTATVTNTGTSSAVSIVVVDTLPATVQFRVGSVSNSLPAGVSVVVDYSNNGGTTWIYVPVSGACGAPATYDRCVNRVRWSLQNPLSSSVPNNSGTLQLIARIR